MRGQVLLISSLIAFVLIPIPSCPQRKSSSKSMVDGGFQSHENIRALSQLDCITVSGGNDLSLLIGIRGRHRDFRVTSNGGKTWRVIASEAFGGLVECAVLTGGNTRGWAVNHDGSILTTRSGGASWITLANLKTLSNGDFTGASQVEFVNETDGWIKELLSIWRTTDGGITWNKKLSPLTPGVKGQPGRIYAIDANTLVGLGDGRVYLTRDGGNSWSIETLVPEGAGFTDVWFSDKKNGWLSGYIGLPHPFRPLLYMTNDGGETWKQISVVDLGILPESVCFVNQHEGWVAGRRPIFTGEPIPSAGVLMHTTDGGERWTQVELGSDDPFFDFVRFTDKQHGWLAGRDKLYRTEDAGKNWTQVLSVPAQ